MKARDPEQPEGAEGHTVPSPGGQPHRHGIAARPSPQARPQGGSTGPRERDGNGRVLNRPVTNAVMAKIRREITAEPRRLKREIRRRRRELRAARARPVELAPELLEEIKEQVALKWGPVLLFLEIESEIRLAFARHGLEPEVRDRLTQAVLERFPPGSPEDVLDAIWSAFNAEPELFDLFLSHLDPSRGEDAESSAPASGSAERGL